MNTQVREFSKKKNGILVGNLFPPSYEVTASVACDVTNSSRLEQHLGSLQSCANYIIFITSSIAYLDKSRPTFSTGLCYEI